MIRIFLLSIAVLMLTFGCSHHTGPGSDKTHAVKIGVIMPLTGVFAPYGKKVLAGIKFGKDQINKHGGVNGKQLELVVMDNQSKSTSTALAFKKLVEKYRAPVVIGAYSTLNTLALKPEAMRLKVPVVTPTATNNVVTERNQYVFRTCFNDSYQARALAVYVRRYRKFSRIGILLNVDEDGTYSRDLGWAFNRYFQALGGSIVCTEGYYMTNDNFVPQLKKITNAKCQALFAPCYVPNAAAIIRQGRKLGYRGAIMGCDGWDEPELLIGCGNKPGDSFFTSMFSAQQDTPQVKAFVAAMKKLTNRTPGICEAQGFDTIGVVASAMKHGITPRDVRAGLYRTANYPGVTGSISINSQRNAVKQIFIKSIITDAAGNRSMQLVKILTPQEIKRAFSK